MVAVGSRLVTQHVGVCGGFPRVAGSEPHQPTPSQIPHYFLLINFSDCLVKKFYFVKNSYSLQGF